MLVRRQVADAALFVPPVAAAEVRGAARGRPPWRSCWGVGLCLVTETAQLLMRAGRVADIDDVICAAAGTVIGSGLALLGAAGGRRSCVVEAFRGALLAQLHDRAAPGEPVRAADLRLLVAALVPLGLREHRRYPAGLAVGVDGGEDQVGASRPGWRGSTRSSARPGPVRRPPWRTGRSS